MDQIGSDTGDQDEGCRGNVSNTDTVFPKCSWYVTLLSKEPKGHQKTENTSFYPWNTSSGASKARISSKGHQPQITSSAYLDLGQVLVPAGQ